jgi:hypothetical protein
MVMRLGRVAVTYVRPESIHVSIGNRYAASVPVRYKLPIGHRYAVCTRRCESPWEGQPRLVFF